MNRNVKKTDYNLDFRPLRVTVHWMRPLGSDCGAKTVASLPVFFMPLCQLRSRDGVSFRHFSE